MARNNVLYAKLYKAKSTVKRNLKELRALIDDPATPPALMRIAYAMECAVRWATEPNSNWPTLANEAIANFEILKREIVAPSTPEQDVIDS